MPQSEDQEAATLRAEEHLRELLTFCAERVDKRVLMAGTVIEMPDERIFKSLDEVGHYVDHLLEQEEILSQWPRGTNGVHLNVVEPREVSVLHELAHALTATKSEDHRYPFRRCFAYLLGVAIGPEAGVAFSVCLKKEGLVA